jgi:hypothetical protein
MHYTRKNAQVVTNLQETCSNVTTCQLAVHSRTQSPFYARCDEGLWPNPYSELASDWLVLTPDIVFLPRFYGIRLWIWP